MNTLKFASVRIYSLPVSQSFLPTGTVCVRQVLRSSILRKYDGYSITTVVSHSEHCPSASVELTLLGNAKAITPIRGRKHQEHLVYSLV